jgi:hypothetical protein
MQGAEDAIHRMTPEQTAYGWIFGTSSSKPPPHVAGDPLEALEAALRPALQRDPCLVMFSGGRDSSAVLAAAVRLARREGYAEPVPLTYVYGEGSAAEESAWQERVVRHLGVTDWQRLRVDDELDLIGQEARATLVELGPGFPPAAYGERFGYRWGSGGAIITGDMGDEVFGAHRPAALRQLLTRRAALRPSRWRPAARALIPRFARYRWALGYAQSQEHRWLRPGLDRRRVELQALDLAAAPLDWRLAIWRIVRRPAAVVGIHTIDRIAAGVGTRIYRPLMDPDFVARLGRAGGRLGYPSRWQGMSAVFGDLLPSEVLRRTSKAAFNESRFGPHSRAFAESWDGNGVDPDLVDPEVLRAEWLSEMPHASSAALLQRAWLAGQSGRRQRQSMADQ